MYKKQVSNMTCLQEEAELVVQESVIGVRAVSTMTTTALDINKKL